MSEKVMAWFKSSIIAADKERSSSKNVYSVFKWQYYIVISIKPTIFFLIKRRFRLSLLATDCLGLDVLQCMSRHVWVYFFVWTLFNPKIKLDPPFLYWYKMIKLDIQWIMKTKFPDEWLNFPILLTH